jgi:predicted amidophosphoribosyltransferase
MLLLWIVCGIGAGVIATNRNANGCLWFGLGVLFGPFALAFAFMAGPNRECPQCKSNIPESATRCPKCQADLAASGEKFVCPECKHPVEIDALKCPGCGGLFEAGIAAAAAVKKCPDCAEEVKADARKCRFCGYRFDADRRSDGELKS